MPDILLQDAQQPLQASEIPKVEQQVDVVDNQTPVELPAQQPVQDDSVDIYQGVDRSLEKYDRFKNVESELSADEVTQYNDLYENYEWDANDIRYALKNKDLAPEQRIQYQTSLNKMENLDHISELFLDPSKLVKDLPSYMQDQFAFEYNNAEGPSEETLKQINQIYLSNVLNKPLEDIAKDYEAIKASTSHIFSKAIIRFSFSIYNKSFTLLLGVSIPDIYTALIVIYNVTCNIQFRDITRH